MAIFSKKICEQKLNTWLAAEEAIATGQSYQMGTHMLTRANLTAVRNEIEYWAGKLAEAEAAEQRGGRNRIFQFVPRDSTAGYIRGAGKCTRNEQQGLSCRTA